MSYKHTQYRGRFAPSPSGPLHFGSLLAATASYLEARKMAGHWWLRIEDIDPPREVEGASEHIIKTLRQFAFEWDELSYQSQRIEIYQQYINKLLDSKQAYYCACSRQDITLYKQKEGITSDIYPGICRNGLNGKQARSIRLIVDDVNISINDAIQGQQTVSMSKKIGDFIVKRADGLYSYQLAVAIDDSLQEMTQVIRGYDLHLSSYNQRYLCQQLNIPSPAYAHFPIAVDGKGDKLSKRTAAKDIALEEPQKVLFQALHFLGQEPPTSLQSVSLKQLWQWAFEHWKLEKVPSCQSIKTTTD